MKLKITIANYEEIMFQLLEDDFDQPTRTDLLQQIEKDQLFKFEWEAWQKTKFADPIENYLAESNELTEKIILIAESDFPERKRILYYWAAAASLILLIASLFLLKVDFTPGSKPEETVRATESKTLVKNAIPPAQNRVASLALSVDKKFKHLIIEKQVTPVFADSNTLDSPKNVFAETPQLIDSVPVEPDELATAAAKKPRYTITIETSDIIANNHNYNDLAQNQNGKIKKVFTNTKLLLSRKPNGEPDKIYIIGDENSYVCLNINY